MWPLNATYSTRITVFFFVMAVIGFGLVFGLGRSIKARVGNIEISKMPQIRIDDEAKNEINRLTQPASSSPSSTDTIPSTNPGQDGSEPSAPVLPQSVDIEVPIDIPQSALEK